MKKFSDFIAINESVSHNSNLSKIFSNSDMWGQLTLKARDGKKFADVCKEVFGIALEPIHMIASCFNKGVAIATKTKEIIFVLNTGYQVEVFQMSVNTMFESSFLPKITSNKLNRAEIDEYLNNEIYNFKRIV